MIATASIAVIGATGAVGREMLDVLAARGFDPERVRAFASSRSTGAEVTCGARTWRVEVLDDDPAVDAEIILLTAGSELARRLGPVLRDRGAIVIDNSSAFRMDPEVPLVVPEVNGHVLERHASARPGEGRLVANPNCSTIVMLLAVDPIHRLAGVTRLVVSTYQAVSGAGAAGLEELRAQARAHALGQLVPPPDVFGEPCAFNVFSHDSAVDPVTGENEEETKLRRETRRIWGIPDLPVTATCVRVPVERAHTEAITLTVSRPVSEAEIRAALAEAPGLRVVDDRARGRFPTPLAASGEDDVLVGRLRPDPGQPAGLGWSLMASGDQLRKGAALNAVQLVELLLR